MAKPAPATRLIKRYAGARFYDAHAASYVSLEEIADLVRVQEQVRVVDAETRLDVTEAVLADVGVRRH